MNYDHGEPGSQLLADEQKDIPPIDIKGLMDSRGADYGPPPENFETTAKLWQVWADRRWPNSNITYTDVDVASMLDLVKTARLANSPKHRDSWMDKGGYAGCAIECLEADE